MKGVPGRSLAGSKNGLRPDAKAVALRSNSPYAHHRESGFPTAPDPRRVGSSIGASRAASIQMGNAATRDIEKKYPVG